jgi:RIO kinase 2
MGRFTVENMRYMEPDHFRVLIAVEMGMKNHDIIPLQLISKISGIYRGGAFHVLREIAKMNLVVYVKDKKCKLIFDFYLIFEF